MEGTMVYKPSAETASRDFLAANRLKDSFLSLLSDVEIYVSQICMHCFSGIALLK